MKKAHLVVRLQYDYLISCLIFGPLCISSCVSGNILCATTHNSNEALLVNNYNVNSLNLTITLQIPFYCVVDTVPLLHVETVCCH